MVLPLFPIALFVVFSIQPFIGDRALLNVEHPEFTNDIAKERRNEALIRAG
jgi:hypothetical protein